MRNLPSIFVFFLIESLILFAASEAATQDIPITGANIDMHFRNGGINRKKIIIDKDIIPIEMLNNKNLDSLSSKALNNYYYHTIKRSILNKILETGNYKNIQLNFEIKQNINTLGYIGGLGRLEKTTDRLKVYNKQQERVSKFEQAVGKAYLKIADELSASNKLHIDYHGGSNGAFGFTEMINNLDRNEIKRARKLFRSIFLSHGRSGFVETDQAMNRIQNDSKFSFEYSEDDFPGYSPLVADLQNAGHLLTGAHHKASIANGKTLMKLLARHPEANVFETGYIVSKTGHKTKNTKTNSLGTPKLKSGEVHILGIREPKTKIRIRYIRDPNSPGKIIDFGTAGDLYRAAQTTNFRGELEKIPASRSFGPPSNRSHVGSVSSNRRQIIKRRSSHKYQETCKAGVCSRTTISKSSRRYSSSVKDQFAARTPSDTKIIETRRPDTPKVPSYYTDGSRPSDVPLIGRFAYKAKTVAVVGKGPVADKIIQTIRSRSPETKIRRIETTDRASIQSQARKYRADVILGQLPKFKQPHVKVPRRRNDVYPVSNTPYFGGGPTGPPGGGGFGGGPPKCPPNCGPGGGGSRFSSNKPFWNTYRPAKSNFNSYRPPSFNRIGGVMLQGAASFSGDDAQLTSGRFSMIMQNGNAGMDLETLRQFVTAMWSVYFSKRGPGISIDPISPKSDKHLVRYIGQVVNSDLGRVMRVADYVMKEWAVGTGRADIPGFKNPDDFAAERKVFHVGRASRFWFVPEGMTFGQVGDALIFKGGRMTLKTEYLSKNSSKKTALSDLSRCDGDRLNKNAPINDNASPANEDFACWFTAHYVEIAEKYKVFRDLFEYAKLVSLTGYLKNKGIPLLWFLLANKDLIMTEDSPGTVKAFAKQSEYRHEITIHGGVDLAPKVSANNYVIDEAAAEALREAREMAPKRRASSSVATPPARIVSFKSGDTDYSVADSQNITLAGAAAPEGKFQTDFSVRVNGGPGLEIARYYDPDYKGKVYSFGASWHLLIPYEVRPRSKEQRRFGNLMIPNEMVLSNVITGDEEVLVFNKDRYGVAGYVPSDSKASGVVGLFLMSDGAFRLADKLGSEFHFEASGWHLTDMLLTKGYHVKYRFTRSISDGFEKSPYNLRAKGRSKVKFGNFRFPKRMEVTDLINGGREVFQLTDDLKVLRYEPIRKSSRYRDLTMLRDGSFRLKDRQDNLVIFGSDGRFRQLVIDPKHRVVDSVSQGKHKVNFQYTIDDRGRPRISGGHLTTDRSYFIWYSYKPDGRLVNVTRGRRNRG